VASSETEFLAKPLIGPGASGEAKRNSNIRQQLQAVEKPEMPIDDKRLASWNALMLQALVAAASFNENYIEAASRQYDFMAETFLEDGKLLRFAGHGGLAETIFEDYAFVSLAFFQYGQAFEDPQAIRQAGNLATLAFQRYFDNDRWHLNNRSLIPGDPGMWVVQDTVLPSALTAWLSVVMRLPGIDPKIQQKGNEVLHRVSQSMIDTPYYYGSFILLRQQLGQARDVQAMAR